MRCPALAAALGVVVLAVTAGCGPRGGTVSGVVTYHKKPLTGGQIVFHGSDNRTAQAIIAPDGSYTVPDAPRGAVKVTVETFPSVVTQAPLKAPAGVPAPNVAPPPPRQVPIPIQYKTKDATPLSFTVSGGTQPFDVELKD